LENISDGDSNQKHSTDDGVMVSSVNNTGDVASELSNGKYSGVLQTGIYSDSISSNTDIVSRTDPMNIDNTKGGNDDNTSNNHKSGEYFLLFLHRGYRFEWTLF
jgi:hypothetical protein